MERRMVSAEEIQQAIDARLNSQQEIMRDLGRVKVQLPERTEPDANGCNWHVGFAGDVAGHEDAIARVISEVQGIYNLRV